MKTTPGAITSEIEANLYAKAIKTHPTASRWYGIRGGATRKCIMCYVCDTIIDTYAGKYPMPKRTVDTIIAHGFAHAHGLLSTP